MAKTVCNTSAATTQRRVPAVAVPRVARKAIVGVSTILPAVVASPAFAAQVAERLNGDGTGLPLGVNDPVLGWVMAGVFGTVWAVYAASAKAFGGQDEEDGLSL